MNGPPKRGWKREFAPLPPEAGELLLADPARIEMAREALRKLNYAKNPNKRREKLNKCKRNGK